MAEDAPFWKTKTLEQLSGAEWEALCDGCGRCCLHKLDYEDSNRVDHTNVACRLLDPATACCSNYACRQTLVPDCLSLTAAQVRAVNWLPPSCAYRLVAQGRDLPAWHYLVCGDRDAVHRSGASVRGRVISERDAGPLEDHIVAWPGQPPKPPRPKAPGAPGAKSSRPRS